MLRKLIKYELLADWKKYVIVGAAMIVSSIMLLIADRMSGLFNNGNFIKYITMILVFVFFALTITPAVMLVVFSTTRFYKSFTKDEGYLTHTLPVPVWKHLVSKLIAVYIWFIFIVVITVLCGGIVEGDPLLIFRAAGSQAEVFMALTEEFGETGAQVFIRIMVLTLVMFFFTPAIYMTHIYLSFALGNLFSKNKLSMSVLMFFVISFVEQTISSLVSVPLLMDSMSDIIDASTLASGEADELLLTFSSDIILMATIFSLVVAVICFIAAERIFSKKLNLE